MLLGYEGLGTGFCIFCLYSIIWFISCACVVIRLKYVRVAGSNGMLVRGVLDGVRVDGLCRECRLDRTWLHLCFLYFGDMY